MNFKACLITLLICIIAQIYAQSDYVQFHYDCMKASDVDLEFLQKSAHNPEENDPKFKDFLFCLYKKMGFLNSAGVIQTEVCKQQLVGPGFSKEKTEKLVNKCSIQKSTPSDTAYEFAKCIHYEKANATASAHHRQSVH